MSRPPIYLDNAATTQTYPEAVERMVHALREAYGNPSSVHDKGLEAERLVKEARRTLAAILDADPREIVFTSGATESNHMAIKGAARARARLGRHVVLSSVEHASALNAAADLEDEGFEVSYVDPDPAGRVQPEAVRAALRDDTVLVSVMAVNNETGSVQDLERIVQTVRESAPKALVHSDAVQAFCKLPFRPAAIGLDLASVTGHKFHAPKGIGALWIRQGVRIRPLLGGSGQEGGLRSGTENVPGIVGLAAAAAISAREAPAARKRWEEFRTGLIERLCRLEDTRLNGGRAGEAAAPHILNISFAGIPGEVLVRALSERGVYVSTGSACSSRRVGPGAGSHVLRAMGVPDRFAKSAIRISFSFTTTQDEVEAAGAVIEETVAAIRATLR